MNLGTLPTDTFKLGGLQVEKIMLGTAEAWASIPPYIGPPSPIDLIATATLVAGIDFPADLDINICMAGGGGSGASNPSSDPTGGGYAGSVQTLVVNIPRDEIVEAVCGSGGPGANSASGRAGSPSSFGSYLSANGGAGGTVSGGYQGSYGGVTTCLGSALDGGSSADTYGGQSCGYSNGGDGEEVGDGGSGGRGSGGGSCSNFINSQTSGAGGSGVIVISW